MYLDNPENYVISPCLQSMPSSVISQGSPINHGSSFSSTVPFANYLWPLTWYPTQPPSPFKSLHVFHSDLKLSCIFMNPIRFAAIIEPGCVARLLRHGSQREAVYSLQRSPSSLPLALRTLSSEFEPFSARAEAGDEDRASQPQSHKDLGC